MFLDGNGNIIGVSYSVPPMTIAHDCDSKKVIKLISLTDFCSLIYMFANLYIF